tara:strand:- start:417 stop:545 length:129 start_codon:yes stop_codon:yes gene_type:complete
MKFMARIFIIMIKALRRKNKTLKERVKVLEEQLYMKGRENDI